MLSDERVAVLCDIAQLITFADDMTGEEGLIVKAMSRKTETFVSLRIFRSRFPVAANTALAMAGTIPRYLPRPFHPAAPSS